MWLFFWRVKCVVYIYTVTELQPSIINSIWWVILTAGAWNALLLQWNAPIWMCTAAVTERLWAWSFKFSLKLWVEPASCFICAESSAPCCWGLSKHCGAGETNLLLSLWDTFFPFSYFFFSHTHTKHTFQLPLSLLSFAATLSFLSPRQWFEFRWQTRVYNKRSGQ